MVEVVSATTSAVVVVVAAAAAAAAAAAVATTLQWPDAVTPECIQAEGLGTSISNRNHENAQILN